MSLSTIQPNTQLPLHEEQACVNQAITRFFDGITALDMQTIGQYATKDLLVLENGIVWDLDTFAGNINGLKAVTISRVNHLDFIRTEITGDTAWTIYNNAADITINNEEMHMRWLESAYLVKEEGEWKIRVLHSTMLKPPAGR